MSPEEKFQLCWEAARNIVSDYRAECPYGFDVTCSWVAVAGLAVTAGTAAYSASQTKKAAAAPAQQKLKTYDPYTIDPSKVTQVDPNYAVGSALKTNAGFLDTNEKLARNVNSFDYQEALRYYNKIQPYFDQLQNQIGSNALAAAQGRVPADVAQQIQRRAAQQGIEGGFGFGSGGARSGALANLNLRNFGLTSLQRSDYGNALGMQVNAQAKSLLPNLMAPQDMFITPQSYLGAQEFNANALNKVLSENAGYINQANAVNAGAYNALGQNIAQSQAAGDLAQAQIYSQGGQQAVGLLGKYFANNSSGGGGGLTGGSYNSLPAGVSQSQYDNSMGSTAFNPNALA